MRENVEIVTASAEPIAVVEGVRDRLRAHHLRNVESRQTNRLRNKQQYPYPPWFDGQVTNALRNITGWRGR